MYTVPVAGAWWPAVGARLDRGVRRHCIVDLAEMGVLVPLEGRWMVFLYALTVRHKGAKAEVGKYEWHYPRGSSKQEGKRKYLHRLRECR